MAVSAANVVLPGTAIDDVDMIATAEHVPTVLPKNDVIAEATVDVIAPIAPEDEVLPPVAQDHVVAAFAEDEISHLLASDSIVAGTTADDVHTVAAQDHVIASERNDYVVSWRTNNAVGALGADNGRLPALAGVTRLRTNRASAQKASHNNRSRNNRGRTKTHARGIESNRTNLDGSNDPYDPSPSAQPFERNTAELLSAVDEICRFRIIGK